MNSAPTMAPTIDPPAPPPAAESARAKLQEATDRLAALTRELADATRSAGAFFALESPADEAAIHAHLDELTRAHRRQTLAVQALQGRLEQAEHEERQRAAATLEEQLAQGVARCEELGRDTAVLVRMYDEQVLVLFELLAQLADADEEGLAIRTTFARLGRAAEFTAAVPIPPGMTAYGQRLHEHGVFTQIPRGEELADGRVRHHHFAEWRRDHRAPAA